MEVLAATCSVGCPSIVSGLGLLAPLMYGSATVVFSLMGYKALGSIITKYTPNGRHTLNQKGNRNENLVHENRSMVIEFSDNESEECSNKRELIERFL